MNAHCHRGSVLLGKASMMLQLDQLENLLGAHQWVSVLDGRGRIQAVNSSVEMLTGIFRPEWVNQPFDFSLASPLPEPSQASMWQALEAGEMWRGLLRTRQRRGVGILTDALLLPCRDAAGQQYILDLRNDVTLLQSHIGKPDSDAGGDELLVLCDSAGRIRASNRAALRWWPGLMPGAGVDMLLGAMDEQLAQWIRRTLAGQAGNGGVLAREVGCVCGPDGRRRAAWVAISARWNREMVIHVHVGAPLSGVDCHLPRAADPGQMLVRQLLSTQLQQHPGLQVYREAGDAFNADVLGAAWSPGGSYFLCLGDGTGTGISGALSSLAALEAFNRQVEQGQPLEQVVRAMNAAQYAHAGGERYLAATVLSVNPESKTLRLWTGGLPPGAMLRPLDAGPQPILSRHPPLGVLSAEQFDESCESRYWSEGMRLALCTDGFSEGFVNSTGLHPGLDWQSVWHQSPTDNAFEYCLGVWKRYRADARARHDVSFVSLTLK